MVFFIAVVGSITCLGRGAHASGPSSMSATVKVEEPAGASSPTLKLKSDYVPVTVVSVASPTPTPKPSPTPTGKPAPQTPVVVAPTPETIELTARIDVTLLEPHVSIFYKNEVIATSDTKSKDFSVVIKLTGEVTEFVLSKVDARGGIQKITGTVNFDQYASVVYKSGDRKKWSVIPALGFTYYNYTETYVGTINMVGLTFKVTGSYRLSDRFDLGANSYITVLPLFTSDTSRTTRFWGVNARLGYKTSWLPAPWAFYLKGGYYYTTMLVSPSDHGFTDMNGPQIYPVVTRRIGKGMGHAYFKYSPIAQLSLSNRELAGGLGYHHQLDGNRTLSFELDVANIAFTALDQAGATRSTNCWSVSLTGGYRF